MTKKIFNKTFQKIMISGRLAKDPEIKFTPKGKAISNFALIVNEENGSSNYIPCVAWETKAQNIADNIKKGDLILCEGIMKSSKFNDQEGRAQFSLQFELSAKGQLLFLEFNRTKKEEKNDAISELPEMSE